MAHTNQTLAKNVLVLKQELKEIGVFSHICASLLLQHEDSINQALKLIQLCSVAIIRSLNQSLYPLFHIWIHRQRGRYRRNSEHCLAMEVRRFERILTYRA